MNCWSSFVLADISITSALRLLKTNGPKMKILRLFLLKVSWEIGGKKCEAESPFLLSLPSLTESGAGPAQIRHTPWKVSTKPHVGACALHEASSASPFRIPCPRRPHRIIPRHPLNGIAARISAVLPDAEPAHSRGPPPQSRIRSRRQSTAP